jgi:transposase-like protein
MKGEKSVKTRRSYDADFKQEMTRMLASGRSEKEISEAFEIVEKRPPRVLYRWRGMKASQDALRDSIGILKKQISDTRAAQRPGIRVVKLI